MKAKENTNSNIEWQSGWGMVFNATFNNISIILWRSVLLVEETAVRGENHWPVESLLEIFMFKLQFLSNVIYQN